MGGTQDGELKQHRNETCDVRIVLVGLTTDVYRPVVIDM